MWDRADFYDAELKRHNRHLRAAASVGARDRVLDIGCGAGQTTREAARVAVEGSAIGVDTSAEMLEIARRRSDEAGLRNVAFEQGDAQHHAFPADSFDLCISRFGVMFFADPAAANKYFKLFWTGVGKDDALTGPGDRAFDEMLTRRGITHTSRLTDGRHEWTVWRQNLNEIAGLLFK